MDIPGGLERLLQTVEDCLNTGIFYLWFIKYCFMVRFKRLHAIDCQDQFIHFFTLLKILHLQYSEKHLCQVQYKLGFHSIKDYGYILVVS
jgi:hypothetical protein